jgi:hypothetical protein
MADDKRPSGPPGGKRRRPPATIDLKATEITSDPVQPAEPVDLPQEPAAAEAQPAGRALSQSRRPSLRAKPLNLRPRPKPMPKARVRKGLELPPWETGCRRCADG